MAAMTHRLIIITSILMVSLAFLPSYAADTSPVIAVMPFANLSGDRSLDWLSEGIPETLTVKLAGVGGFRLVERLRIESVLREQSLGSSGLIDAETAVTSGRLLGAGTVVSGAYQTSGHEIRLTARFLATETGMVSHTAMATGTIAQIFALQDTIADAMLASLSVTPSSKELATLHRTPTTSIDAYRNFSEGIIEIKKGDYEGAKTKLDHAVAEDPAFRLAQENLAYVEWARPSANASIYMERVNRPFAHTFNAMMQALKSCEDVTIKSISRERGTIEVSQPMNIWSVGQDMVIEIKDLETTSGVRIFSQTQETFLGIRQIFDWGESRRSIEKIIAAFERSL